MPLRIACPILVQDGQGNLITGANAALSSKNADGTAGSSASLYASPSSTSPLTQPIGVVQGRVPAFADPGSYIVGVSGVGEPRNYEWEALHGSGVSPSQLTTLPSNIVTVPSLGPDVDTVLSNLSSGVANSAPLSDVRLTNSRSPSGNAGGDLSGSYPNPVINRAVVSVIPSSPVDGQEVLFQSVGMKAAGVAPYRLRYDTTISGSLKWAVLSAQPWLESYDTTVTHGSTTYTALSGASGITLPLGGNWLAAVETTMGLPSGASVGGWIYASTTNDLGDTQAAASLTGNAIGALYVSASRTNKLLSRLAGAVVKPYARVSGAPGFTYFFGTRVIVTPLLVG